MRRGRFCLVLALVMFVGLLPFSPGRALAAQDNQTQGQWLNLLLIGTDTRADEPDAGRSDAMMILSIHQQSGQIKLASLARDMWVAIPGHKTPNKLNAAHSFGGPELLMETINQTFAMDLAHYVSVNFFGIATVVDALGGISLDLEPGEATWINNKLIAGVGDPEVVSKPLSGKATSAHLTGAQVLAYTRIRELDNDFGRTQRQRRVLQALLEKVKGQHTLPAMGDLAASLESAFSTNMALPDLINQALLVLNGLDSPLEELALPPEGTYRFDSSEGVSKVIFDAQACTEALHAFIYGQP